MYQNLTAEQISEVLFSTDPMGTCCKENDCFDEYDAIAKSLWHRLQGGQHISTALNETFVEWFAVGALKPQRLEATIQALHPTTVQNQASRSDKCTT